MDPQESPSWTFERQPSGFTTMMKTGRLDSLPGVEQDLS
jgi:hypothetical protein